MTFIWYRHFETSSPACAREPSTRRVSPAYLSHACQIHPLLTFLLPSELPLPDSIRPTASRRCLTSSAGVLCLLLLKMKFMTALG